MKRKNIISLLSPVYLIIQLFTFSTALGDPLTPLEDYRIVLSWSTFESELEAVLIVPNVETGVGTPLSGSVPGETSNKYVFSTGDVPPEPSITQETFTIRKFSPGTYQLWVKSKFVEEGFGDTDFFDDEKFSIFSNSNAKIEIFDSGNLIKTINLSPNPHGLVWLPLEIDGSTKKPIEVNKFYDHLRAIHGSITDAVTGNPLDSALIIVKNRDTRETEGRVISNKNGEFVITVDPGRYVVYIGKKSYISDKFDVDVIHDFPRSIQAVLTKIIPNLNYRIILTWGRFPIDLDAHLKGPNPGHEDFHIYWNRRTLIKGKKYLDRDDRYSYGPETITIRGINPGEYTYTVHNYSGRNETSGNAMSQGNVEVRIYNGDKLLKKYRIPRGTQGNYWKVFELDGKTGEVIDINQTGFESDPDKL
ncbi:MAG: carboxypeptidase regulatory-like domain-containing protein [Candidatus Marinimicrobia bacterium]|nr:carboxypeptidase regulatory-like domain-containing protein [Candidatus Neomarinimicrobiota bacterium]